MKKPVYKVIIFGPQGSGKGTQAILLAKELKLPLISMGDILRRNIKSKTKLGLAASKYVGQGSLLPDVLVNKLMLTKAKSSKKGFIIDGYPRNFDQAKFFDKYFDDFLAVEINLSDQEAVKRIAGRRSCACGAIYHIIYKPSKQKGICDKCGKKLFVRQDDKLSSIRKRLAIYRREVKEIEKIFLLYHALIKVDGRPKIEKIQANILKKVNEYYN